MRSAKIGIQYELRRTIKFFPYGEYAVTNEMWEGEAEGLMKE